MNELIKELANQALKECDAAKERGIDQYSKRFAELIVVECIECADFVGLVNIASGYPNSTAHHVKQKIKQHFGVEE